LGFLLVLYGRLVYSLFEVNSVSKTDSTLNDVKIGFDLVRKKYLSFYMAFLFLADIGLLLFAVIAIPVIILVLNPVFGFSTYVINILLGGQFTITPSLVLLVALFLLPVFTLAAPIFRLARDAINGLNLCAEKAYTYLKEGLLPYAFTCFLLYVIVVLPPLVVAAILVNAIVPLGIVVSLGYTIGAFIYVFIMLGLLNFTLPALVYGAAPIAAIKESIGLVRAHPVRTLSIWIFYSAIGLVYSLVVVYFVYLLPLDALSTAVMALWILGGATFLVIFITPAAFVSLTYVYGSLTKKKKPMIL
jgi:hypothetical protein